MSVRIPIFAIVGKPNVGKSSLFNTIVGEQKAIVEDTPGVTRDRTFSLVSSYEIPFYLVDTAGLSIDLEEDVKSQSLAAIESADVCIALLDTTTGITNDDSELVKLLRDSGKPTLWVANKCDGVEQQAYASEFYSLGVEELHFTSAKYNKGVGKLVEEMLTEIDWRERLRQSWEAKLERKRKIQEEVAAALEQAEETALGEEIEDTEEEDVLFEIKEESWKPNPVFEPGEVELDKYVKKHKLREDKNFKLFTEDSHPDPFCTEVLEEEDSADDLEDELVLSILGRPNAGKSTLLNLLAGEQRALVSPIAGTTRDSIDLTLTFQGQGVRIVDTAGLRKKSAIDNKIEQHSALRTFRALTASDVCLVLLDSSRELSDQDSVILSLCHEHGRGVVIGVSKWDIYEKDHKTAKKFEEDVRRRFPHVNYAPIVFFSGKSGKRCPKLIEAAIKVAQERNRRINTGNLNKVLRRAMISHPPPRYRHMPVKFFYAAQVETSPPQFVLFFNQTKTITASYTRYIKRTLREAFKFEGSNVIIKIRKTKNRQPAAA